MATSPATPAAVPQPPAGETPLEFPDNRLLIDLCGPFDQYLTQVETALELQIVRRGNRLILIGEDVARQRGAEVLGALYARLEAGRTVEPGDVDAELRMDNSNVPTAPSDTDDGVRDGDQIEMFQGGRVEIKTRKKLVEPRTDAQQVYVRSLYANELAFGIGPAGTGKTYLAVAVGVSMFIGGHVDKIILSRPAVEAGRASGLPSRRHEGQGRSVHAAAL